MWIARQGRHCSPLTFFVPLEDNRGLSKTPNKIHISNITDEVIQREFLGTPWYGRVDDFFLVQPVVAFWNPSRGDRRVWHCLACLGTWVLSEAESRLPQSRVKSERPGATDRDGTNQAGSSGTAWIGMPKLVKD
jgi:hypothetical protein